LYNLIGPPLGHDVGERRHWTVGPTLVCCWLPMLAQCCPYEQICVGPTLHVSVGPT